MAAVASGAVATGVGIDEDTMLTVTDAAATVTGAGRVWAVRVVGGALTVRVLTAGDCVEIGELSS
jgi:cyanophycinase-like exopeptidase